MEAGDDRREVPCPAVRKIVAVDRRYHDMAEAELADRFGDVGGLVRIERARLAGGDIAEGAGPRAGIAHDHESRVLLLPALADVGAGRLLAHRRQPELAHQALGLGIFRRGGRTHPDPIRLAPNRTVPPLRLFGGALGPAQRAFVDLALPPAPD